MRVLLINQFFWPELAATSQLLTELARHLAAQGHEVTVICASSTYAGPDSSPEPSGVTVRHVRDLPFTRGILGRMASYASFFPAALWLALRTRKPDLVVTLTTPPLVSCLGTILKRVKGARHIIWEMDIYPELSVALGVFDAKSLVPRVTGAMMRWSRNQADKVIALGECMRERLLETGLAESKIAICENWADSRRIGAAQPQEQGPLGVIYPGNLGLGHEARTLTDAIADQVNNGTVRFTFVGGGGEYERLREFCVEKDIANVTFLPYRTVDELAPLLESASIGLVTQKENCSGYLVPSKVYPMMAAGLALLFIGPASATPARIIRRFQCGWHFEAGDRTGLAALFESLTSHPESAYKAGQCARKAFLEHYDLPIGVARIAAVLGVPAKSTRKRAARAGGVRKRVGGVRK